MGEIKSGARGVHGAAGRPGEDPFVELAEMFEADIGRDAARRSPAHRAPPTAYDFDGRHLDAVDRAFDEAFEDVLSADLGHSTGRPQARITATTATAYRNWLAPKTAPMGSAHASLALDDNLEDAIHNLSAPANPRNAIFVETQSFAPDRVVDDYRHESVTPELDDFDELIASEMAVMNDHTGYVQKQRANAAAHHMAAPENVEAWYQAAGGQPHSGTAPHYDPSEYAYDDAPAEPARRGFLARRGMALAGGVMSLALVGALSVYVLGGHGGGALSGDDGALLIKADAEPYKVPPKDPGGRSIPNQNKAVYDRVANPGTDPATKQQALLTDSEEPMDLPAEEPPQPYDALPGVELGDGEGLDIKSENRLETAAAEPTDDEAETAVLQPRKVRTMVVRPDGTIVASGGEGEGQGVSANGAATSALIEAASRNPAASALRETAQPVVEPEIVAPEAVAQVGVPIQIADPMQVAAIPTPPPVSRPPAAAPASENGYFVQISSQPSEALAQQTMQNLSSRFASVIDGRSVAIKSAEIPGKGTFYRVRVAAASKQEAGDLCSRLKSAGGNCFVAR